MWPLLNVGKHDKIKGIVRFLCKQVYKYIFNVINQIYFKSLQITYFSMHVFHFYLTHLRIFVNHQIYSIQPFKSFIQPCLHIIIYYYPNTNLSNNKINKQASFMYYFQNHLQKKLQQFTTLPLLSFYLLSQIIINKTHNKYYPPPKLSIIKIFLTGERYYVLSTFANLERRNIHYYLMQIRHMYKDESISMEQTENQSNPQRSVLLLKGNETTYYKQEMIVDFQPVKAIDPNISPHQLSTFSIIPTFNKDSKYYTSAFVNPFDYESKQETKMLNQHRTMVKQYSREIPHQHILMPKPRSGHYCCVCKVNYDDYLEHIEGSKHIKLIQNSRYSYLIHQLAQNQFRRIRKSNKFIKTRK